MRPAIGAELNSHGTLPIMYHPACKNLLPIVTFNFYSPAAA